MTLIHINCVASAYAQTVCAKRIRFDRRHNAPYSLEVAPVFSDNGRSGKRSPHWDAKYLSARRSGDKMAVLSVFMALSDARAASAHRLN